MWGAHPKSCYYCVRWGCGSHQRAFVDTVLLFPHLISPMHSSMPIFECTDAWTSQERVEQRKLLDYSCLTCKLRGDSKQSSQNCHDADVTTYIFLFLFLAFSIESPFNFFFFFNAGLAFAFLGNCPSIANHAIPFWPEKFLLRNQPIVLWGILCT